jgi:hypothetical protein
MLTQWRERNEQWANKTNNQTNKQENKKTRKQ